jgi:hypothetical protein
VTRDVVVSTHPYPRPYTYTSQLFDWESLGRDRFLGRVVLPLQPLYQRPNVYVDAPPTDRQTHPIPNIPHLTTNPQTPNK